MLGNGGLFWPSDLYTCSRTKEGCSSTKRATADRWEQGRFMLTKKYLEKVRVHALYRIACIISPWCIISPPLSRYIFVSIKTHKVTEFYKNSHFLSDRALHACSGCTLWMVVSLSLKAFLQYLGKCESWTASVVQYYKPNSNQVFLQGRKRKKRL